MGFSHLGMNPFLEESISLFQISNRSYTDFRVISVLRRFSLSDICLHNQIYDVKHKFVRLNTFIERPTNLFQLSNGSGADIISVLRLLYLSDISLIQLTSSDVRQSSS